MNETIPMLETAAGAQPPEQISYTVPRERKRLKTMPLRVRIALAMLLCVGVLLFRITAPATAQTMRRWIVGDGSEQVQQAFFSMERLLEEGEGLGAAWEAFCADLTDEPA